MEFLAKISFSFFIKKAENLQIEVFATEKTTIMTIAGGNYVNKRYKSCGFNKIVCQKAGNDVILHDISSLLRCLRWKIQDNNTENDK